MSPRKRSPRAWNCPTEGGILAITIHSLAFSPDTSELACLARGKDASLYLLVWGADGKISLQHHLGLQIGAAYMDGPEVVWAPDGQGWLLHGNYLFDRQLQAVTWICNDPPSHNFPQRFLDDEHLLTTRGDFQEFQLVSVKIPRKEIAAVAASLTSGQPALLKPGDAVALQIQLGQLRYSAPDTVTRELTDAVTKRLTAGGLTVGLAGAVTLTIKYSEVPGETLRVVEQPGGFGERYDTGQRVNATVGRLEASMSPAGGSPIWETSAEHGSPYSIDAVVIDDAKVRDAMFQGIQYMLSSMSLPYFVPADPNAVRLPITISTAKPWTLQQ